MVLAVSSDDFDRSSASSSLPGQFQRVIRGIMRRKCIFGGAPRWRARLIVNERLIFFMMRIVSVRMKILIAFSRLSAEI